MKRTLSVFGAATLAAGLALAQNPTAPQAPGVHAGNHRLLPRLTTQLNLTADQRAQAKQIFHSSRTNAQPLAQQLRDARLQLAADVKTGASQDLITKDSSAIGALSGQMTALHATAMQKFYAILTPEQKTKLDSLHGRFSGHRG